MTSFIPRRRAFAAILAASLAVLGGCSEPDGENAEPASQSAEPAVQNLPAGDAPAAAPEPARFTSEYTTLDLAACDVMRRAAEGHSVEYRCPGRGNVNLLLHDGDGRFDFDVGVRNEEFQSIGAFNSIASTIEWRLDAGTPVAVVFRLNDATLEDRGRSVLAIEKVGTAQSPGCRIAQIAGDTPDLNARARSIADERAAAFDCSTDQMQVVGNAL